jgi:hypothetical protein
VGVTIRPSELTRIGQRFAVSRNERWHDREVAEVFAARVDLHLTTYHLHPDEVDAIVAINIDAAISLFEDLLEERVVGYEARRGTDGRATHPAEIELTRADFVEMNDDYAIEALSRIVQIETGEAFEPFLIKPPPEK